MYSQWGFLFKQQEVWIETNPTNNAERRTKNNSWKYKMTVQNIFFPFCDSFGLKIFLFCSLCIYIYIHIYVFFFPIYNFGPLFQILFICIIFNLSAWFSFTSQRPWWIFDPIAVLINITYQSRAAPRLEILHWFCLSGSNGVETWTHWSKPR